ncbi:hypothetical protein HJC23_002334 [Cyclotella cryptica]|uniref:Plastid lipid-associated protein/fibrillin conserved domain-containing protein n=1 Tax=Cyclotella cryptica TaxID=29204 RepID=A0ABD3QND3_9STRA|eukprot:CCRYP_004422-RA/>CCRYP_004422-RA protein AED:0.41 eAED:0.41 QI:0/-1/0/1/-1/1/1/0/251
MKRSFIVLAVASCALSTTAFTTVPHARPPTLCSKPFSTTSYLSSTATTTTPPETEITEAKAILSRAAETKLEDPDKVMSALESLEKHCKAKFKQDPATFSKDILDNISGEWRLIFTTGTKERQKKAGGRVNYFPLKAIQKFDAMSQPKVIENGIYAWDWPLVRFSGDWDFDERRRKLEFDFDLIEVLGLIKIKLGRKDVAKIGATTGLGSANNEKLADSGRRAFFDWISADEEIATARGGGGGLALWKRVG